ncbi:hypothetical protein ACH5RR_001872 [Cinchona calisaya]|uniref:MADS-box domain-containing protein n=1 Tax=Cinchona calisaya TaxID=153742 RepID=A0ABD3B5B3_9GENT
MGRGKLKMELISKEKSRNITFKKRKEGLMRKIHEFTTLCDVHACMIIYSPKQEKNSPVEPEIWPEDPDEISRIISLYKGKFKDSGTRIFSLLDFFHQRKKRVEDELEKLRKRAVETKYPTCIEPMMSHLTEIELREFACSLSNKLEVVKSRIESIKGSNDHHLDIQNNRYLIMNVSQHEQQQMNLDFNPRFSGLIQRVIELELMKQEAIISPAMNNNNIPIEMHGPIYSTIDQEHHQIRSINQNNKRMLLLMDENDHQYGGGGGGVGCGVLDNMVHDHSWPLMTTHLQPPLVPCMHYNHPHLMPNRNVLPALFFKGE